jgi:hypothetical protein
MYAFFILWQILEKAQERTIEIHRVFFDFKVAYDSVTRTGLCKVVVELDIQGKLTRMVKAAVENM